MIKTLTLAALALTGMLAAAPALAQGTPMAGVPKQCFSPRDIRNFAAQDDYTVNLNLNIDRRDVYQLKTVINCPDVGIGAGLAYKTNSELVCGELDITLVTRTTRGLRECPVKSIRKLSVDEVAALPSRARP